jgi:hypothetical protein
LDFIIRAGSVEFIITSEQEIIKFIINYCISASRIFSRTRAHSDRAKRDLRVVARSMDLSSSSNCKKVSVYSLAAHPEIVPKNKEVVACIWRRATPSHMQLARSNRSI